MGSRRISSVSTKFRNSLISHNFRYLRIGMFIIQIIRLTDHAIKQISMRETFCSIQVFTVIRHLIGICIDFIHSAELIAQHLFHLIVIQGSNDCQSPIAQVNKHLMSFFTFTIQPGISQTGIGLVKIIPGYPVFPHNSRISFLYLIPNNFSMRNSTHITIAMLLLTTFQFGNHVIHSFLTLLIAGSCIMNSKCR